MEESGVLGGAYKLRLNSRFNARLQLFSGVQKQKIFRTVRMPWSLGVLTRRPQNELLKIEGSQLNLNQSA